MRQRGRDSWQLRVYLGTAPETGRPRWLSKTVHGTQRFARGQLADLVEEATHARIHAGTLAELLDHWFEAASPAWATTTTSHTRSVIDCYLKPHLGHLDIAKLTTADIDDFYGYLLRAGGRDERPLAPGTVARVHGVLHRALAQAVRWEWIWLNPATNATPPRVGPAEIRPPSPRDVTLLLESVRRSDPPLHCYLRLAVCTGARRSQLLALRWGDIDLDRAAIAFTRALVIGPDGPELRWTKTRPHLPGGTRPSELGDPGCSSALCTGSRPDFRGGANRRLLRIQLPTRWKATLAAESPNEALHPRATCRRTAAFPVARPAALHGDRDAGSRCPYRHGLPTA